MDSFAFEVAETARAIRRAFNRRVVSLGATRSQWRVLARLARSGDAVRQGELAEALDVEPITMCRMIDRLEEAGLVERRRDPQDRRAWRIHLTEKAGPVITGLEAIAEEFTREMLAGVPAAERDATLMALARIRDNLSAEEDMRRAS